MNESQQKEAVALVSWLQTFPSFSLEIVQTTNKINVGVSFAETVEAVLQALDQVDTVRYVACNVFKKRRDSVSVLLKFKCIHTTTTSYSLLFN
jgi:fibrillarin-like rRNA methylase